jgi:hypothetical protein
MLLSTVSDTEIYLIRPDGFLPYDNTIESGLKNAYMNYCPMCPACIRRTIDKLFLTNKIDSMMTKKMASVSASFAILVAIGFTATTFTSCRKNDSTPPPAAATSGKKMYDSPVRSSTLDYSKFTYFIPTFENSYEEQKCPQWCWAACVKMVLKHNGYSVTQENIVKSVFGVDERGLAPCRPGEIEYALDALPGQMNDDMGTPLKITYAYNTNGTFDDEISGYLSNHQPIILGLSNNNGQVGHAVVMFGADYHNGQLSKVLIADPYPGSGAIKAISADEFKKRAKKFIKITVTRNP